MQDGYKHVVVIGDVICEEGDAHIDTGTGMESFQYLQVLKSKGLLLTGANLGQCWKDNPSL